MVRLENSFRRNVTIVMGKSFGFGCSPCSKKKIDGVFSFYSHNVSGTKIKIMMVMIKKKQ